MRILFLCEGDAETRDSWSGVSQSVVRHLRARGHTVVPGDADLYGLGRFWIGVRCFGWPWKRWWARFHLHGPAFEARSAQAERAMKAAEGAFDLILQVGATFRVRPEPGVPLVLYCDSNIELARRGASTGHSEAAPLRGGEIRAIRRREEGVYHAADLIFTMSDMVRESFMDDFGVPESQLVTIHCAPNFEMNGPGTVSEPARGGPPTVLFVGRDFRRKGGDLLVDAFQGVRRSIEGARLRIVGARPRGDWPDWIEFTGYLSRDTERGREAMDRAYVTSHVFCLPTRFEPFGTSFVEAMSYGLPCVGPRAWAVPEIIEDGRTGLLVPPEDPDALEKALVTLLADHELSASMGRAGRERARSRFSWPELTSRMLRSMEPLVEGVAPDDSRGDGPKRTVEGEA